MRSRSQSLGRPQVEAAGGEPQYPPVPAAALQGEQRPDGGRTDHEAELKFEALVSSGETRRYVLTANGVHVRVPAEGTSKAGRGGPKTVGPDHAGIPPAWSAAAAAAAAASPFGVSMSSAPPPPSLPTQPRAAEADGGRTTTGGGSEDLQFSDARSKTKLLADLLDRTGLGGAGGPESGPAPISQVQPLRLAPSGDAADAAAPMPPADDPTASRSLGAFAEAPFASTLDADGVQSAPAESGLLDPSQSGAANELWHADTQLAGPEVQPVSRQRRRSLSQSQIPTDVATGSKGHSRDPPRRSSSLSNRASRHGTGAKVVDPPGRSSSRSKQRRAELAPEESAPAAAGAPDAPEKEAGPGPAANTGDEPQADSDPRNGVVVAGHPEAVPHGFVPDVVAPDVATHGVVRQAPQEQDRAGRENKPVGEAVPPEKLYQAFLVPSAEPRSAAVGTSHQKSETTPLPGAGADAAAGICASGKDWRASCLPIALSKVESVAQTAQHLAEENARLKKEITEIQRNRQLENLRFERLSFAAYRKLTEVMADKAALETEVAYLRNSLAELTAMIHLVDSGLPSQPAQPPLRPTK